MDTNILTLRFSLIRGHIETAETCGEAFQPSSLKCAWQLAFGVAAADETRETLHRLAPAGTLNGR